MEYPSKANNCVYIPSNIIMHTVTQNTIASNDNEVNKIDRIVTSNDRTTIVESNGLFSKPLISLTICVSILCSNFL